MVIRKDQINNVNMRIKSQTIEGVSIIKYLRCGLNEKWDADEQINIRIEIARNAFKTIKTLLCNYRLSLTTRWRDTK